MDKGETIELTEYLDSIEEPQKLNKIIDDSKYKGKSKKQIMEIAENRFDTINELYKKIHELEDKLLKYRNAIKYFKRREKQLINLVY